MSNYVYIATSIDGFIATSDGGIDWLREIPNPEKSDYGYSEFINNIDAIVMGRNTFDKVLTFGKWPYSRPVFVLSKSTFNLPQHLEGKAEILNGNVKDLTNQLEDRGYKNLYIDGGKVIQSFLKEDLIDEIIITRIPVILGDGISLFGKIDISLKYRHTKTEIFNDSLVKSCYVRDR